LPRRPDRLRPLFGTLVSRETSVITNAIAFNFLLCLFPLLLVVAGFVERLPVGSRAGAAILALLGEFIPFGQTDLAASFRSLSKMARGLEAVSLLLVAWGGSGIFMTIELALNRVWGGGVERSFWKSRLLAFGMTLLGGLLAALSVFVTVATRAWSREWPALAGLGAKATALALSLLMFFLVYRLIPHAPVRTGVALRAALWAGGAWELVKYAFVWNLARTNLKAFYGSLAFAVSLVLWAYVSSLVLVFGALMSPVAAERAARR
jgi:YihY family inner membrane protein